MTPTNGEWEDRPPAAAGNLTVLTVRQDEAVIRDFRCDCRGETSCRAELGELLQLLERRRADIAVFLAHPDLVRSLIEELGRRGKQVPEMVIAPSGDSLLAAGDRAQARLTVSVSLSGLSESAHPQEILARLYQALRAAQGPPSDVTSGAAPLAGVPAQEASSEAKAMPGGPSGVGATSPEVAKVGGAGLPGVGQGFQPADSTELAPSSPRGQAPSAAKGQAPSASKGEGQQPAGDERARAAGVEEMSARLERILDQRLQHGQGRPGPGKEQLDAG